MGEAVGLSGGIEALRRRRARVAAGETSVRRLLRNAMLVPWALPGVGIGIVWTWAFDATYGSINGLLYNLGIINDYIAWLQYGWVALDIVAVVFVWNQAPMAAILFLAGLQAIP